MVIVLFSLASVNTPAEASPPQAGCSGPGKQRWPIKVSIPADANIAAPITVPFGQFIGISDPGGIKPDDSRFETVRIPDVINGKYKEGQIVSTTGWLYLVLTEADDCDYHIQISDVPRTTTDKPTPADHCIVVEVPRPDFAATPDLRNRYSTIRDFIKTRLLNGKEPGGSGNVMQHPVYVRITGALFFDDTHLTSDGGHQNRGRKGMQAQTLWEIHPIVDFQFAPKPQ